MSLSLKIKTTSGLIIETQADRDLTIFDLKAICCEELETDPERQTLLYKGKVCDDDLTLEELGIQNNSTFIVLLKKVTSPKAARKEKESPPRNAEEKTDDAQRQSNNSNLNHSNNAALGNMASLGMNADAMQSMQQSLMQNPEMMKQMMQSPLMKNMLQNPEVMQNLFNSSPALQQLMKDNPQLRHVLKDPSLMEHAMRAASNPEYYNEMLKNNDRALRNIESIPGGFSALSRLYNQIQKPMERAMDDIYRQRFGQSQTILSDISDKSKGPTTKPMENPWGNDFKQKQQQQQQNRNMLQSQQSPNGGMADMMGMMNLMSMMNSGQHSNPNAPSNANQFGINSFGMGGHSNPSQLYTQQLQELRSMGFEDEQRNCNALVATGGNVAAAVQYLLDQQSGGGHKNDGK